MKFNSPIISHRWTERSLASLYVIFAKYFNMHFTTFSLVSSLPHSHFACLFHHHVYNPFFLLLLQNSTIYFWEVRKRTGGRDGSGPSFLPSPQEPVGSEPRELGYRSATLPAHGSVQSSEPESHPL